MHLCIHALTSSIFMALGTCSLETASHEACEADVRFANRFAAVTIAKPITCIHDN